MYSLKSKLKHCLASMEKGNFINLKSGHRLVIPEGYDEPGFQMFDETGEPTSVMQVGSETAWMMLIQHVKEMTKDEAIKMMFSYADVKLPGAY